MDPWSKLAALIGAFLQHSRKEFAIFFSLFLPFLSSPMKKSAWRDPLAADSVLRSTAWARICRCPFLLVNSTKVWECLIVFTAKLISALRDVWSRCHSSGTACFAGRNENSKWLDDKFAPYLLVKASLRFIIYHFKNKSKWNQSSGLFLSPCLHNCSRDSTLFGLFGWTQSLQENKGYAATPCGGTLAFRIKTSASSLFHDPFLGKQKIY